MMLLILAVFGTLLGASIGAVAIAALAAGGGSNQPTFAPHSHSADEHSHHSHA